MKKSTKKAIMAITIMVIFGISSIAFLTPLFTGTPQAQNEFKPLTTYIVDGQLSPVYKSTYIQNGFTWLEYYYNERDDQFIGLLDSLPQSFTAPSGEPQMVVQKLNQQYLNSTDYVIVSSPAGIESIDGKDPNKLFTTLCNLLTFRPIECDLGSLDSQAPGNGPLAETNETTP